MTEVILAANQYGKAENRVVRVIRDTARHEVVDLNVTSQLRGDFEAAHTEGDNATWSPPTPRRTRSSPSPRTGSPRPEAFLLRLANHFTGEFDWVTGGRWAADQFGWTRINDHDHSFYRGSPEVRTAVLVRDGDTDTMLSAASHGLDGDEDHRVRLRRLPRGQVHDAEGDRGPDPRHRHHHQVALQHHRPSTTTRVYDSVEADHHDQFSQGYSKALQQDLYQMAAAVIDAHDADRRDQVLLPEQAPLPLRPVLLRSGQPRRGLLRRRPAVRADRGHHPAQGRATADAAWVGVAGFC